MRNTLYDGRIEVKLQCNEAIRDSNKWQKKKGWFLG
jgi:hypothetical protein